MGREEKRGDGTGIGKTRKEEEEEGEEEEESTIQNFLQENDRFVILGFGMIRAVIKMITSQEKKKKKRRE